MDEADKARLRATIGVSGRMFLLVPAHPGGPGRNPESRKMVVCVCVCVCVKEREREVVSYCLHLGNK